MDYSLPTKYRRYFIAKKKSIVVASISLVALFFLLKDSFSDALVSSVERMQIEDDIRDESTYKIVDADVHFDKWIVLTSISSPTKSVRIFAEMKGWKTVVVGDSKTPHDWSYPGVIFLSLEMQKTLPYKLAETLPIKSYPRKMIGYLYAIHHGAQVIYDTDDDNEPTSNFTKINLEQSFEALSVETKLLTYNAYMHFGQSSTWPRGYPIDLIDSQQFRKYCYKTNKNVLVKQYLQDVEPDVDGLFHLTRGHNRILIDYDHTAPPVVIPQKVYTPYNSQATIIHYDAFWSLFLPVSVNWRSTDIYRGYIGQRLIWDLDGHHAFMFPLVEHIRNAHNVTTDFFNEFDFFKMSRCMRMMDNWKCPHSQIDRCMVDLTSLMIEDGHYGKSDFDFTKSWISDLHSIGYKFPIVKNKADSDECIRNVIFYPKEQRAPLLDYDVPNPISLRKSEKKKAFLKSNCNSVKSMILNEQPPNEIVLVIHISSDTAVPVLLSFYENDFTKVIFCGFEYLIKSALFIDWEVTFISIKEDENPIKQCLSNSFLIHGHAAGYLYLSEKDFLNVEKINSFNKNLIWTNELSSQEIPEVCTNFLSVSSSYVTLGKVMQKDYAFKEHHKNCLNSLSSKKKSNSKILYIPLQEASLFQSSALDSRCFDFIADFLTECLEHLHVKLDNSIYITGNSSEIIKEQICKK